MGSKANNDLSAAKPEDAPEDVQNDQDAAEAEVQVEDDLSLSEDEVQETEPQPGDSTKATVAGNTNPKDFEIFDENGNFVEKRDR